MYMYTVPRGGVGVVLLQRYYLNCLLRGLCVWSIGVGWWEVSAVGGGYLCVCVLIKISNMGLCMSSLCHVIYGIFLMYVLSLGSHAAGRGSQEA
jgi:hypothetical protein